MWRYPVSSPQFLVDSLKALDDDYSLPWDSYPCLIWDRALYRDGYGMVHHRFKDGRKTQRRAHREAWRVVHGRIPKGVLVCHHCDNPACFRPIHLFLGTNSTNMLDSSRKGRNFHIPVEAMRRGEEHGIAKLTEQQVREIRSIYVPRINSQSKLAARFGVSQKLIGDIVRRRIWRHI